MNKKLKNKIDATNKSIAGLLKDEKFYIDYFQREYRWKEKHIRLLIEDITFVFLKSYDPNHKRPEVDNYQNYYLGPMVFNVNDNDGKQSIIDGQQRITSITLLLIYLNHLQSNSNDKVPITDLVYSEKHGEKSFNMTDKSRQVCLKALLEEGTYKIQENDDETVKNIFNRYGDISDSFPEEINEKALPYFIDWFIDNIIIVKITAYSDENAYTIFETMNDRGLNLTPTEMLKGYVLSKITNTDKRTEIDDIWKTHIQKLHEHDETADMSFFQAWFRAKYAESIRQGKVDSVNRDFELISSFHNWFKENHKKIFNLDSSDDFYQFFKEEYPFYVKWYLKIKKYQQEYNNETPHLYYIGYWGIAESLQDTLLLSSINKKDDDDNIIEKKMDSISRYIETFTVRRSINYKNFSYASIKYTIFNIIKSIRNNNLDELRKFLANEINNNISENWDKVLEFRLHGQNRKFVKHLLSRISSYIDSLVGKANNYVTYHHPQGKQFEIEHIWANKFENHKEEFEQKEEFELWRNSIGALILLPNGNNQSYKDSPYSEKIKHYIKENTYAQTLCFINYENNPNFINSEEIEKLEFKPHPDFNKKDIDDRQALVKRICEKLWSTDYFEK